MSSTRDKLQEAIYFLEQMRRVAPDPSPFKFTLSAFVSAARSVTFIMQKEYGGIAGFVEWYEKQNVRMKSDTEMKLLHDKHVMTIHLQSLQPLAIVSVAMNVEVAFNESIIAIATNPDSTILKKQRVKEAPAPTTNEYAKGEWKWYFEEVSEKDVITLSEKHTSKLNSIVEECEALFRT